MVELNNKNRFDGICDAKNSGIIYKLFHSSVTFVVLWALILNLAIETLGRFTTAGIWGGFQFLINSPAVFLYNAMIIFSTLIIGAIFRRRAFVITIVSIFWLTIGISNGVILTNRMTPFTTKDLAILDDGLSIVTTYLTNVEVVLVCAGLFLAIIGLLLLFFKGPKTKDLKRKKNLVMVVIIILCTLGTSSLMIRQGKVETFFGNLAYAYRDYGVAYCFINTWLNTGIDRPSGYSEENVLSIFDEDELGEDGTMILEEQDVDEEYPNIIFLQLESFIDPETVNYLELSEDPCPNFRKLFSEYSSGALTTPACGAGTANVEFEVLTGISVKFFGPGEYPYKSILTETTAESLAYDLSSLGYSTHAIHNHRAVFYNRNKVFSNLGFDTFTSIEYMNNVAKTAKNWAKDEVLTGCIMDALESTDTRDMIYTISVQGHGKYPTEQVIEDPVIQVTSAPTEELKWKWEYYVNQVYEMDQFIGELIDQLSQYEEPVMLIMYGDHIPAIDLTDTDLDSGNLYGTQYVIWTNYETEKVDKDLCTYQLTSHVMELIDMEVGTVFTYQLNHSDSSTYEEDLKTISYDILYGSDYIYGGINPFEASDLKMGVKDIKITDVVKIGANYYIKGENFTPYSKVTLNGKELKTMYLGQNILGLLEEVDPDDVENMKVSQIESKSSEILSTTE